MVSNSNVSLKSLQTRGWGRVHTCYALAHALLALLATVNALALVLKLYSKHQGSRAVWRKGLGAGAWARLHPKSQMKKLRVSIGTFVSISQRGSRESRIPSLSQTARRISAASYCCSEGSWALKAPVKSVSFWNPCVLPARHRGWKWESRKKRYGEE